MRWPDKVRLGGRVCEAFGSYAKVSELQTDPSGLRERQSLDVALRIVERRPPVLHDRSHAHSIVFYGGVKPNDPGGGIVVTVLLVTRADGSLGSPLEERRAPLPFTDEAVKAQLERPLPMDDVAPLIPFEGGRNLDPLKHRQSPFNACLMEPASPERSAREYTTKSAVAVPAPRIDPGTEG